MFKVTLFLTNRALYKLFNNSEIFSVSYTTNNFQNMPRYLLLFEHSGGLALFDCKGVNEIAVMDKEVQKSFLEFSLFSRQVSLLAFKPFPGTEKALETMEASNDGQVSPFMLEFLAEVLPQQLKKHKSGIVIGVSEKKLAGAITQQLDVKCQCDEITRELFRGIQYHFDKFVDIRREDLELAQLGLAHAFSRSKVKFNVHGDDNMIISAVALLTGLDKDVNTFAMRLKEWYGDHFPELSTLVPVGTNYARCVEAIGDRRDIESAIPRLREILEDDELVDKIVHTANCSTGRGVEIVDIVRLRAMAKRVEDLIAYRDQLAEYLHKRMHSIAPNVTALAGDRMGAQLIMASGSLTNLAKAPASTVQLLGAEKALFNALKKRKHTPKYGMIYNSGPVQASMPEYRGRTARSFANKISIAARVDAFGDEFRSGYLGTLMKEMMDQRVESEKTGQVTTPNLEAMEAAVKETRRYEQNEGAEEAINDDGMGHQTPIPPPTVSGEAPETPRRRRKKHHRHHTEQTEQTEQPQPEPEPEPSPEPEPAPEAEPETPRRRKHRRHHTTE